MNIFTEITVLRSEHRLVDALLHYLVDGDIQFMIQKKNYDMMSITVSVMDRIEPTHLLRSVGRTCGANIDPPIQIRLGLIQADGLEAEVLDLGRPGNTLPKIPEELLEYHAAVTDDLRKVLDGDLGRELDPGPGSWQEAQTALKAGETLGVVVHLTTPVYTSQGLKMIVCLLKIRDATEWLQILALARQPDPSFAVNGIYALPEDRITWTTTKALVEIEGLDPNNVLGHDPDAEPPAQGTE